MCSARTLLPRAALEAAVEKGIRELEEDALAVVAKVPEEEVERILGERQAPERLEAELARVEERMRRLVDLAAEGELAADVVRDKLADLEGEGARLRQDLEHARVAAPAPGAEAEAIRTVLADVSDLLRGDLEEAREALRVVLRGEPLRVVRTPSGYLLEGVPWIRTGALEGERRFWKVAGAGFEPATCGL